MHQWNNRAINIACFDQCGQFEVEFEVHYNTWNPLLYCCTLVLNVLPPSRFKIIYNPIGGNVLSTRFLVNIPNWSSIVRFLEKSKVEGFQIKSQCMSTDQVCKINWVNFTVIHKTHSNMHTTISSITSDHSYEMTGTLNFVFKATCTFKVVVVKYRGNSLLTRSIIVTVVLIRFKAC